MTYLTERITIHSEICNGEPTIRGNRVTVQTILEYLSAGESHEAILKQYPIWKKKTSGLALNLLPI